MFFNSNDCSGSIFVILFRFFGSARIRLIAVLIEDPAKFLVNDSVQERRSLFVGIISVNKFPLE